MELNTPLSSKFKVTMPGNKREEPVSLSTSTPFYRFPTQAYSFSDGITEKEEIDRGETTERDQENMLGSPVSIETDNKPKLKKPIGNFISSPSESKLSRRLGIAFHQATPQRQKDSFGDDRYFSHWQQKTVEKVTSPTSMATLESTLSNEEISFDALAKTLVRGESLYIRRSHSGVLLWTIDMLDPPLPLSFGSGVRVSCKNVTVARTDTLTSLATPVTTANTTTPTAPAEDGIHLAECFTTTRPRRRESSGKTFLMPQLPVKLPTRIDILQNLVSPTPLKLEEPSPLLFVDSPEFENENVSWPKGKLLYDRLSRNESNMAGWGDSKHSRLATTTFVTNHATGFSSAVHFPRPNSAPPGSPPFQTTLPYRAADPAFKTKMKINIETPGSNRYASRDVDVFSDDFPLKTRAHGS